MPDIVWRAGLDLNPLDIRDRDATDWLQTLVWPEQTDRAARLQAAVAVARRNPPRVIAGDLRRDLAALAAQAPRSATLVVFHTAVLAYVASQEDREDFAAQVRAVGAHWISCEGARVFSGLTQRLGTKPPIGRFVPALDGEAEAWAHPHGLALAWIG